jgi:SNF2 family DNA or RNA helicase
VDEAHFCKNWQARRTRAVTALSRRCVRVCAITGTPLLGSPGDLVGVLKTFQLLAEAYEDEDEFNRIFKMFWMRVRPNLSIKAYGSKPIQPDARDGLARVMLRRLRRDMLNLPPVIEQTITVTAPRDLRPLLKTTLKRWDRWGSPDCLPPFELLSAALAALAESRIKFAKDYVREAMREGPIVVFSAYRAPILAMHGPRTAVVTGDVPAETRKELVDEFQAGKIDCIAGTFKAMGTGFTMVRAARVLLIDEDYTPAVNEQAIGRLLRHGQTQSVLVERMRSDHPLDRRRAKILAQKTELIQEVVGA